MLYVFIMRLCLYVSAILRASMFLCVCCVCLVESEGVDRWYIAHEYTQYFAWLRLTRLCALLQLLATFITHYEFRKGVISGGVLFFYWLLLFCLGVVPFRSNIMRMQNAEQVRCMSRDNNKTIFGLCVCLLIYLQVVITINMIHILPNRYFCGSRTVRQRRTQ